MTINPSSQRAKLARLSRFINTAAYRILVAVSWTLLVAAIAVAIIKSLGFGCWLAALALAILIPAIWWKRHLSSLAPFGNTINDRLSGELLATIKPGAPLHPQALWGAINDHWQVRFMLNHLLLTKDIVAGFLSTNDADTDSALQYAQTLADSHGHPIIEPGFVAAGLLAGSPQINELLKRAKANPDDIAGVAHWLGRHLADTPVKQSFGGVGRDWAFGFTPVLDRMGMNISYSIEKHGAHFGWLTKSEGVRNVEGALANHANGIALIGAEGIGKTTSIYALAQRLIEGDTDRKLAYHQIVSLNAADIISRAHTPGSLEQLMIAIANEAAHAGHIILFFDNAQLFFGEGPGSFDASQILLPILEARTFPMIFAFTPPDYQRLKAHNASMANLLTPVVLQELPEPDIMRVLEDTAVRLESQHHILVPYESLREAYRLSGRYEFDEAYPGKAIKLLEQAVPNCVQSVMTLESVQKAVEQSRGVKVSMAAPAEAETLLNLEDKIHERMINQTHAVKAIAGALRRARAGVTNPKRPIGSFLFLGPTGVGKTELAKAIAAIYFGAEDHMIRLDMSEYQQPDDVQRLLASGQTEASSLLLAIRQNPFSVVLLDEIEKAHPNVLNLLLQLLDEGQLTDATGRQASFKDSIIIATSNAGAQDIREHIAKGEDIEKFRDALIDQLINSGQYKPELLNRFDDIVLFRPLNETELAQVVKLLLKEVNATLATQNITVDLTDEAIQKIVAEGNDPRLGARPMRRALQRAVEDTVAQKILRGEANPGDTITLDAEALTS
jgi:ATP-dependent Clp protease ATP-binding subunit ClpC